MKAEDWNTLGINYLKPSDIPDWEHLSVYLVKRLNDSIPKIGKIKVTSTTGGGHATGSAHYKGLAADIRPLQIPLYHAYQKLVALGWKRIGIDAGQNILHVDVGELAGFSSPYYFLELSGKDAGPLSGQSAARLAAISGYSSPLKGAEINSMYAAAPAATTPVTAAGAKASTTAAEAAKKKVDAGLLIAAALPLFYVTRG